MTIEKRPFGKTKDGIDVDLLTLRDGDMSADIITYGAAIRAVNVPAGDGVRDVVLGFDDIAGYEANKGFHGAIIGRIGNRVANARYTLGGEVFNLDVNDGRHSLHGGFKGFDKQVWSVTEPAGGWTDAAGGAQAASGEQDALELVLVDREGTAAGYQGDCTAKVRYSLSGNALGIEYTASCTKDTPLNLTNHVYFNLSGQCKSDITGHKIQIISDKITAVDETLIPTGELMDVSGTPFDLRELTLIAPGLESGNEQIKLGGGYDHNWVLADAAHREPALAAVLSCCGLRMECFTTKPGIQFYSGNMMGGEKGKYGAVYSPRMGLCLETQYWPNSVNTPAFPAPILRAGGTYNHKTVYKFVRED